MDHGIFGEISLIVTMGSVVAMIMHRLKQPLIVGHIITGILAGPLVFNIVHAEDTVEVFARIGIALLLFIIGLGLNPNLVKDIGKVSSLAAGFQVLGSFILGYLSGILLGLDTQASLVVGIVIAFSSTIIILKLMSDKKEQNRLHGRLVIGLLLIQDLFATVALLILSTSNGDGFTVMDGLGLVTKGTLLIGLLYSFSVYILPRFRTFISESQELLFLAAIGWGLGLPALFEVIGFSFEVGALLAGVTLSTQNYAQEISAKLRPLRDFFIVLFFVELGTILNFAGLGENLILIILLCFIVIVINPILAMSAVGFFGYTKKTSFMSGITMSQISEFSLIFAILANEKGIIDNNLVSALTFVALISIGVSTYIIKYSDEIYDKIQHKLRLFDNRISRSEKEEAQSYDAIVFGYKKGGEEFVKTFKKMKRSFVVIDYDPHVIDRLDNDKIPYLYGDATDSELFEELNINNVRIVVATFSNHEDSLFIAKHFHGLNEKIIIVLSSDSKEHSKELYDAGASYVMLPHFVGSEKLSSFIKRNGFKKTEFNKFKEKNYNI